MSRSAPGAARRRRAPLLRSRSLRSAGSRSGSGALAALVIAGGLPVFAAGPGSRTAARPALAAGQEGTPSGANSSEGWPGGPETAAAALRAGRYEEAEDAYRHALHRPGARRGLAETLRLTGRYRQALEVLEAGNGNARHLLDRALLHREIGEDRRARALLTRLLGHPPDRGPAAATGEAAPPGEAAADSAGEADGRVAPGLILQAEVLLADLELAAGERERALSRLDGVVARYNAAPPGAFDARALTAAGVAATRLGFESSGLYRDALRVFDEAALLDPGDPAPHLAAGDLLARKFNDSEAARSFGAVLERNPRHPEALLGLARVTRLGGGSRSEGGESPLQRALGVNRRHPGAVALHLRELLEAERLPEAEEAARAALAGLPEAPELLAALGAVQFLGDDPGLAETEARFRAARPGDPRFDVGLAEAAERQRRYREAAERARAAASARPDSAAASRLLGLNLLRLGAVAEGREVLEDTFRRDPFDALVKNTLDLLDELDTFEVVAAPPLELVLPATEAALLAPYAAAISREALDEFRARYGFVPEGTVRIEFYDRSADFSVRTVGLTGIGAHGVCFGETLALESPSARPVGSYHWASTLWHELAHTATMGLTGNRVPRWFTEGLSVWEERRRFGDGVNLAFLAALRDGRLLPVGRLNDGFTRPSWPGQVAVSYYHASLVVEHIEAEHGFPAIEALLEAFGAGASTPEALTGVLGIPPEELDAAVNADLEQRFGAAARGLAAGEPGEGAPAESPPAGEGPGPEPVEALVAAADRAPQNFVLQLRAGAALFEAERDEEAAERFRRVTALVPEYGGRNGPHRFLARIHERAGRPAEAAAALARHLARAPAAYRDWLLLAEMRGAADDAAGAAEALGAALLAYPLHAEPHERLAEHAAALGDGALEVRERRAALAADPPGRAEALYRLADALHRAGDTPAARRRVLEALEIAPTYDEALRLLLDLRRQG